MSPKNKKGIWVITASVAGALAILVVASLLIMQSLWFSNWLRDKVIATLEDSTGGKVDIGSFQFDPNHLTVLIRNLVIHGTEPRDAAPLAAVSQLELRLKLFSGFYHTIDLAYLAIREPRVNVIVNRDGSTNIPSPKVTSKPNSESPLATVVDLAIGQFQIVNGTLAYSQETIPLDLRGENLKVQLKYNSLGQRYQGTIDIAPFRISTAKNADLAVRVSIPLTITREGISVKDARLVTEKSKLDLDASLTNLAAPKVTAKTHVELSISEMRRILNMTGNAAAKSPEFLTADIDAGFDQSSNVLAVRNLHAALGRSSIDASGTANAAGESVQFKSNISLAELGQVAGLMQPRLAGDLLANGSLSLDSKANYLVRGTLHSDRLSIEDGSARLSNVSLSTPFQISASEISLNPLQINALGGTLSAKVLLAEMRNLSVEAEVRQMSLRGLTLAASGHPLEYGAAVSATLSAHSDLQAQHWQDFTIHSRVSLSPRNDGVPLSGRLNADYVAKNGSVNISDSYLGLPRSRITLAGSIRDIGLKLTSRNLDDFLPLANYGASKRTKTLPVHLRGGEATIDGHVRGELSAPQITAHAAVTKFAVQQDLFDELSLDVAASPSGARVENGLLLRNVSRSTFSGSLGLRKWQPVPNSPVAADVAVRNAALEDILAIGGSDDVPVSGAMNADIHLKGTYGDPLGFASVQIPSGDAYGQPFQQMQTRINLSHGLISFDDAELFTERGKLSASGAFHHPSDSLSSGQVEMHLRSQSLQLSALQPLQKKSPGAAGEIDLTADAKGGLNQKSGQTSFMLSDVAAHFSASNLKVQNQSAGNLNASASTAAGVTSYSIKSNFAGSEIAIDGRTKLSDGYYTEAKAVIRALPLRNVLEISGQGDVPISGLLTANLEGSGTSQAPNVTADVELTKASAFQEPINHLLAKLRYSNAAAELSSLTLNVPAGEVKLSGRYQKPARGEQGVLQMSVSSGDLDLAKVVHVQDAEPGLGGTVQLSADIAAKMMDGTGSSPLLLSKVNSDVQARGIRLAKRNMGDVHFSAQTSQATVHFQLDSNLAQSQVHASGESQLAAGYPTRANLTFSDLRYANLAPFMGADQAVTATFDALVDGKASVDGPISDTRALKAQLELSRLDVHATPRAALSDASARNTSFIENDGPITASLDKSVIRVDRFRLRGRKTSMDLSGTVDIANANTPLAIKLKGDSDLSILEDMNRKFYSSGNVTVDAALSGTFSKPLVNGKIELRNANINYSDVPNGLSNGNGVIQLNGTTAALQNVTGESGGGKIAVTGFAGLSPQAIIYNLHAKATNVRTRFDSLSITSNGDLALTGNSRRSVLGGKVVVQRIAYSSSSDIGSLLNNASSPPSADTTAAASPLLDGMRMDINVSTASDVRIITSYVEKIDVNSALTVRGTAAEPGVVGHVNITSGQLVFFGNTYTVNRGTINFFDATAIKPQLDFSLETVAQGVDVVLSVTGSMNSLKLSYRSDPPLTFEQIVQLLATNTTPFDPTIAAHQPTPPPQSMTQVGESAVLGQAVANPVASRVQRIFGLSQFRIDPSIAGSNGLPSAKVSLQQKIASNITFTYITDVTQSNSEIVRVQWDLNSKTSAVALRDYNGNVSVELFHKFQVR